MMVAAEDADRPGVSEMMGSALSSGDLSPKLGPCGLDKVMALGLLGMRDKMADAVFRLKYRPSLVSYQDTLKVVEDLARRLDRAENWRMQPRIPTMAKAVLDYWLDDICEVCGARKADVERMGGTARKITGTPALEDAPCQACSGSGKRPLPWAATNRDGVRLSNAHTALLVALEETERRLAGDLVAKLFAARKPNAD